MAKFVWTGHAKLGEILKSGAVLADLYERASRVAEAAEARDVQVQWPRQPRIPMPYLLDASIGESRARARVVAAHPSGLAAEAKFHTLTAAMDAAAG